MGGRVERREERKKRSCKTREGGRKTSVSKPASGILPYGFVAGCTHSLAVYQLLLPRSCIWRQQNMVM